MPVNELQGSKMAEG